MVHSSRSERDVLDVVFRPLALFYPLLLLVVFFSYRARSMLGERGGWAGAGGTRGVLTLV